METIPLTLRRVDGAFHAGHCPALSEFALASLDHTWRGTTETVDDPVRGPQGAPVCVECADVMVERATTAAERILTGDVEQRTRGLDSAGSADPQGWHYHVHEAQLLVNRLEATYGTDPRTSALRAAAERAERALDAWLTSSEGRSALVRECAATLVGGRLATVPTPPAVLTMIEQQVEAIATVPGAVVLSDFHFEEGDDPEPGTLLGVLFRRWGVNDDLLVVPVAVAEYLVRRLEYYDELVLDVMPPAATLETMGVLARTMGVEEALDAARALERDREA